MQSWLHLLSHFEKPMLNEIAYQEIIVPEDFYHSEATNKRGPCVTLNTKIGLFVLTSSVQPVDSREATNVTTNYKQAGPPAKTALLTLASQRLSNIISLPCFCTSFIWLHLKWIKFSNPRFLIPLVRQFIV